MGWTNPPVPWAELERRLSGRPYNADGGDSPAWSNHRGQYQAPPVVRRSATVDYAELHCHSNFSFLHGSSHSEELWRRGRLPNEGLDSRYRPITA
ncbi:MAG TPA: hypothetical protein VL337_10820 [Acidimicrobiales bacterium]|nr:hypothetical protein [Acidimicrobiales bacterium]